MIRVRHRRVIVVTGASAGVGRAIVRAFAKREGAKIALIARSRDGLDAAKREIEELDAQALALPADVSDARQVEAAATAVEQTFGPIDVWINNAMVSVFSPVKEMTAEDYKRVTDVTYLGYVHGTLAALRRMLPRNRGLIIQIGSALAYRSIPLQSAYCAAKAAVMGFNESLRTELLHDKSKIQVCMVHLPAVNTPQFLWVKSRLQTKPRPVAPVYQPEVIADAIIRISHRPRREVYLGLSTMKAIYADKYLPNFADWYAARVGVDTQLTDEPDTPERPYNLWKAVPGDHGAHGPFDGQAKRFSVQMWVNTRRRLFTVAALAGAAFFMRRLWQAPESSLFQQTPSLPRSRSVQ